MSNTPEILAQPYITITNIIWSFDRVTQQLQVLLIKRANSPYANYWALPETFMRTRESADEAALRLIREKNGLTLENFHTEQLATFTNRRRSPGQRSLSLAYMTFLPEMPTLKPGYGATAAHWFTFAPQAPNYAFTHQDLVFLTADAPTAQAYYQSLPTRITPDHLAYDHEWILKLACNRIKNKLDYQPNILLVLGDSFTLKEARTVYAPFLNVRREEIDNSNFKKTHKQLFTEIGTSASKQIGRPAKIYKLTDIKD